MKPSVSRPTASKVKVIVSGRDAEIPRIRTSCDDSTKAAPMPALRQLADDRLRHFASFR